MLEDPRLHRDRVRVPRRDSYEKRPVLSATIHPDIKRTLVSMSKRTGMTVSQGADEVLYTGLIEMQELDARAETSTAHSWCEEIRKVIPQNKHQNGHKI